ncbi:MAG: sensor domain-containing diguanylate cyclase [Fibrobacteria bacterium]|nr:sensor domain-containing diguanylate cyclase [Fibrobacteria bacterium]
MTSHRDPSGAGLPHLPQFETQDLAALGTRAAIAMSTGDTNFRAFQAACSTILEGLSSDLEQVRIYLLDPVERILREEAAVDHDGGQQGSDLIPLYQLPEELTVKREAFQHQQGEQWEILVPLHADSQMAGMLALVSYAPLPSHLEERTHRLARSLSLGVLYVQHARQSERAGFLLKSVTRMSRELTGLDGRHLLLETFVTMAANELGFDRASIFVFDDDSTTVRRALCARAGFGVFNLVHIPEIPDLDDTPVPHPHLPGLWIPIRMGSRRLGVVFADNIYSLEPPPRDAIQALVDLSAQAALALENARLFEKLRDAALRDDLTGLYRSGYFTERVKEELANSRRRKDSTGLLMLDLDRFKNINDTFGHPVGDEVLLRVADRIRQTLRVGDIACRKGGDEFTILVPGLNREQAGRMAGRLIEEVRNAPVALPDGRLIEIGLSVGISLFPHHAGNWQELWEKADEALYVAKQGGRGRWSVSGGPAQEPKTR